MKSLVLLILLFFFSSCDKRWSWYTDNYMAANVKNKSSQNVMMIFCSNQPKLQSTQLLVFANGSEYTSKTYLNTAAYEKMDRPQQAEQKTQSYYFSYAHLSSTDLATSKLCVNADADFNPPFNPNATFSQINTKSYLVINQADVCPADFKDYNQSQSPCQVSF